MHAGSHTFGYEVTTFHFSHVSIPGSASGSPPVSLFRTDVAITDETGKRFHQKVTYYFPQSGRLSSKTLSVQVGAVSLTGASPQSMTLRASLPGGTIALHLASQRSPMYVGGRGYLTFPTGFTYYYSLTDVKSTGTISVRGKRYTVSGISWLDHQWGNWSWASGGGWTWMALQLDNGTQLSLFDVRAGSKHVRGVSALLANGTLKTVKGLRITSTGSWRSPHTGAVYPSGWIVTIPALGASLTVRPKVLDQEVVAPSQPQGSYWEGSGRVSGTFEGKHVTGYTYTELTGYAHGQS